MDKEIGSLIGRPLCWDNSKDPYFTERKTNLLRYIYGCYIW